MKLTIRNGHLTLPENLGDKNFRLLNVWAKDDPQKLRYLAALSLHLLGWHTNRIAVVLGCHKGNASRIVNDTKEKIEEFLYAGGQLPITEKERERESEYARILAASREFAIPDSLWDRVSLEIKRCFRESGGIRRMHNPRKVLTGVLFLLFNNRPFAGPPLWFGSYPHLRKHFHTWIRAGIFDPIWTEAQKHFPEIADVPWRSRTKCNLGLDSDSYRTQMVTPHVSAAPQSDTQAK